MAANPAEGRREDALIKERAKMREEFERQKQKLISETEKARPSNARFVGTVDSMEDHLKKTTVGLVKLEDFQQRRKELEEAKAREAAKTDELKYVLNASCTLVGDLPEMEVRLGQNRRKLRNERRRRLKRLSRLQAKRTRTPTTLEQTVTAILQARSVFARTPMSTLRSCLTENVRSRRDEKGRSFDKNG